MKVQDNTHNHTHTFTQLGTCTHTTWYIPYITNSFSFYTFGGIYIFYNFTFYFAIALNIVENPSAFNAAPPTRNPSISAIAPNSAALSALAEPPY